jgi:thiol:disulfide interchange protein
VSAGFIWLAASAGGLSLLTPCVFPMVPITVSYFTNRGTASWRRALWQALLFGAGIVTTFTALGLALAVFVGATAAALLAANPWVNIALAAIFVAFALNLFGVYQIVVPAQWLSRLDRVVRRSQQDGRVSGGGALLTGLIFTLTSFTCTAPFVGTVLVTAAQGNWQMPLVGMLVYSVVFAFPFCVLAFVPQWIAKLPRAGTWLGQLKVVMGVVELAAAAKFLSNADLVWHWGVFTRQVVLLCWVTLAALTAVYLWGWLPVPSSARDSSRRLSNRIIAGGGALAVGAWLATGLTGHSLGELESFLPPSPTITMAAVSGGTGRGGIPLVLDWRLNDYAGALAEAKREHKRLFIDFTGYTCTNCRWMEGNMFSRPDVKAALSRYALSRLFTDGEGAIYERQQAFQQAQFNTVALPLYVIVDSDGHTISSLAGLTRDPVVFLAFLASGLASVPSHQ